MTQGVVPAQSRNVFKTAVIRSSHANGDRVGAIPEQLRGFVDELGSQSVSETVQRFFNRSYRLVRAQDVDPRFGMGVAAIFAAIASEYIVTASFPDTNVITLADKLHLVTFGFVFGTLAQSTWSLKLSEQGREAASRKLDGLSRWAFPLAYVVVNALLIVFR